MSYVSNCLADIAMKSSQRAALEAEQRAFLRRGGKITEVPGFTANPPTLTQQQRIAAAVADHRLPESLATRLDAAVYFLKDEVLGGGE